ncbi:MAG: S-layer homology domain-containing protein [Epulopiscium sp.]|nr:S-layer homology domain-containing protein [Candidatus Epulonipiscium sp.]
MFLLYHSSQKFQTANHCFAQLNIRRYAVSPNADTIVLAYFNDVDDISEYAKNALAWAYKEGIIACKSNGMFDPKGMATRAEVAKVIESFVQMLGFMD